MNVTNLLLFAIMLLVAIFLMMVEQFYPRQWAWFNLLFWLSVIAFALYGCYWLLAVFPGRWKKSRAEQRQRKKDEAEYWEWYARHEAIRHKYDPEHQWNEATTTPYEYQDEIDKLNAEYRDVFKRLEETS